LGATAAIGTIEDVQFLAETFRGVDAVYTMLPPPNFTDPKLDLMELCRTLTNNYAQAIQQAGVKRVVHLSSIGAHLMRHLESASIPLTLFRLFCRPAPARLGWSRSSLADQVFQSARQTGRVALNAGQEFMMGRDVCSELADDLVSGISNQ
jgi:nucleoside-diphosphate-sugar epimerase